MNLKKVFIVSAKAPVSGGVTAEIKGDRAELTAAVCGLEKGSYGVFMDGEKVGHAEAGIKGRIIKRIDITEKGVNGRFCMMDEFGREVCFADIEMNYACEKENANQAETIKNTKKTYTAEDKPNDRTEHVSELIPKEETKKEEYGFSSDLGTIIKRFKEQMERLEKSEVLTAKEAETIEKGTQSCADSCTSFGNIGYSREKVNRDYIWNLPIKDIHFPSNLFLTYSQKKYGHILLEDMSDRYRIGAADTYSEKKAVKAAACGFSGFAANNEETPKEGTEGYWIAEILKTD